MMNVRKCPPVNVLYKDDTVKSFFQDDTCCNDTVPVSNQLMMIV